MATTLTNNGITYVCNGTATTAVNLDLGLWSGVPVDETLWLDGQATAGYPGNLDGFQATNAQVAERHNARLLSLSMSDALADTNTLTLSGNVSKILTVVSSHKDASASLGVVKTSDLVLTFDVEQTSAGSTDDTTGAELLLVVV